MLTKRALRFLLVAEILLAITGGIVTVFTESLLPAELQAYEQAVAEADHTTRESVLLGVGIVLLVFVLVSSIGLFVFWRPARLLYFCTVMVASRSRRSTALTWMPAGDSCSMRRP